MVLADEINRATPRTQSGLLEAMEERQVTTDGVTAPLERPFFVVATQNPLEIEGTFALPEAQLDQFLMRLRMGYPTETEEAQILQRSGRVDPLAAVEPVLNAEDLSRMQTEVDAVHISEDVRRYLLSVRPAQAARHRRSVWGGSPRASVALFKAAHALAWVPRPALCPSG